MTMSNEYQYLYLLLVANAVLLTIGLVVVFRFERRWRRIECLWDSTSGAALDEASDLETSEQILATRRLEQRLAELQRTVKLMDRRAPEEPQPPERSLPIENAVRMARLGASVEDLTRSCGLNVGEAHLMKKLHGRAPAVAKSQ